LIASELRKIQSIPFVMLSIQLGIKPETARLIQTLIRDFLGEKGKETKEEVKKSMSRKKKDKMILKGKPTPATISKANHDEKGIKKPLTIQAMIGEFAEQPWVPERPAGIVPLLTSFVMYLDKKGFITMHERDIEEMKK